MAGRVLVTGLGVVSPLGTGTETFWQSVREGRLGTGRITKFDTRELSSDKGGVVKDFVPDQFVRQADSETLPRCTQFAVAVARMALEDAGLLESVRGARRVGVSFGVVHGNRPTVEALVQDLHRQRGQAVMNRTASGLESVAGVGRMVAEEFDLRGPNVVSSTACAAGNSAITYALNAILGGRADVMVAGGCDELSYATFIMFDSFRALAPEVVQPFDKNRKGLIVSEGAGALLLESYEHARMRGAPVYGEVLGHGNFCDAYHMTAPHPDGLGAIRSLKAALEMAKLSPDDVDHINAHGTGTPSNDLIEAKAIRAVFRQHADSVAVSSIKSMIGHTQGAASAIEAVSCLLSIRDQIVPPTINVQELDPRCNLDIVVGTAREQEVRAAMNNSFGFGGNVSCVVFGRFN